MGHWVSWCVRSVVGWLIVCQDGDYLYLGKYSQNLSIADQMIPTFGVGTRNPVSVAVNGLVVNQTRHITCGQNSSYG